MKPMTKFVLAALAAMALVPATTLAEDAKNQGYALDTKGSVVMTASGLCVRNGDWTPADRDNVEPGCPNAPKPVALAPAPRNDMAAVAPPAAMASSAPKPVPAIPTKMSFSSDALFGFDKSELKPAGKAMLDDLVNQLNGVTYSSILVTGHADRLGSTGYNQKLSERRANSVKDYLVGRNILASRIDAEGRGESQPIVGADECRSGKRAKIIACLQPDRRVDVEMRGTEKVSSSR